MLKLDTVDSELIDLPKLDFEILIIRVLYVFVLADIGVVLWPRILHLSFNINIINCILKYLIIISKRIF